MGTAENGKESEKDREKEREGGRVRENASEWVRVWNCEKQFDKMND